jgi:hypothetical protein
MFRPYRIVIRDSLAVKVLCLFIGYYRLKIIVRFFLYFIKDCPHEDYGAGFAGMSAHILISAADGYEWSASRPGRFNSGNVPQVPTR